MRSVALLLVFISLGTAGVVGRLEADDQRPVGKRVAWQSWSVEDGIAAPTAQTPANTQGVREETPNERRRRLGEPIVASFPPLEYGELLETPNHIRKRLGLASDAPIPDPVEPFLQEESNIASAR